VSAVVIPAPGELGTTASLLLSLADDVHDVRTISNGTQFQVPDYLADRYHARLSQDRPAPARRRGRPPKNKES
jgi:hypothetical protein